MTGLLGNLIPLGAMGTSGALAVCLDLALQRRRARKQWKAYQ